MLMLVFHLGDSQYTIPVNEVVEVAPHVELGPIARAPEYIAGLFNYRGQNVPVIDLCRLLQEQACRDSFTTRIILVHFPLGDGECRVLGLLAERVTETVSIDPANFTDTGILIDDAPYLGQAAQTEQGLIQQVSINDLLPAPVQAQLYPAETR
jgi:chemotaxis-related protein WspB